MYIKDFTHKEQDEVPCLVSYPWLLSLRMMIWILVVSCRIPVNCVCHWITSLNFLLCSDNTKCQILQILLKSYPSKVNNFFFSFQTVAEEVW